MSKGAQSAVRARHGKIGLSSCLLNFESSWTEEVRIAAKARLDGHKLLMLSFLTFSTTCHGICLGCYSLHETEHEPTLSFDRLQIQTRASSLASDRPKGEWLILARQLVSFCFEQLSYQRRVVIKPGFHYAQKGSLRALTSKFLVQPSNAECGDLETAYKD